MFRGRISGRKFRDLARHFALVITADRAAILAGLYHKTAAAIYTLLRLRMALLAEADCPFRGQVEIDASRFGPGRPRGHPGRGAARKTPATWLCTCWREPTTIGGSKISFRFIPNRGMVRPSQSGVRHEPWQNTFLISCACLIAAMRSWPDFSSDNVVALADRTSAENRPGC
ncbi:hypothetical protein GE300_09545 [Rhodobacteraceae bacterium 2CG4]|uniref:Transposase n=1 Tax=Halovulum marinum TaxID=2662447 RepID=A0A6L5Z1C1_9RHOB|nr:hypothetical protein [Halovulum marinum]